MINLLPDQMKKQVRAARTNILLVRYNILLGIVVVLMALGSSGVFFVLRTIEVNAQDTANNNQGRISAYAQIEAEASLFRTNLATAKSILDREFNYTNAILNIAQLMPANTAINKLALDSKTFDTPIILDISVRSYEDALKLKDSFEQSTIFRDVHFTKIANNSAGGASVDYPYTASISVIMDKSAAKR